ncbi:MAG: hypothetical protein JW699_03525 [Chitinispirillaceae bacterium]|nr:hypothetical protein [Chitinispirillaceae bacterium]
MLPSSWVLEHFLNAGKARRRVLSSDAIVEGIRNFSRAAAVRQQFESLEPHERIACSLAYLNPAGVAAFRSGRDTPANALDNALVRSFLVYAGRNADGAVRYFGFPEFEPVLRELCAKTIAGAGAVPAETRRSVACGHGRPPVSHQLNDIAVMAVLALHGVLARKQGGGLTGAALDAVARLTRDGRDCPADLLVFCGLKAELLSENAGGYSCAAEAFEAWLLKPADRRLAETVCCAVRYAGSWSLDLLREAFRQANGMRLSCSIFPEDDRPAAMTALHRLRWAGIVELARAGKETVFGAAQEPAPLLPGPERGSVIVLPDFTAVIAQEARPEDLYGFGIIGTLQSLDQVYKGAVERRVLNDSLARGVQGEVVLGRLEAWRAPRNVIETVREWIREFQRLSITSCPMLVAADEKVAFEIGAYGPLRGLLEPVPAHTLFRIRPGAEVAVKGILETMGYDYRMPCRDDIRAAVNGGGGAPACRSEQWEPVVGVGACKETPAMLLEMRGKKYGAGLKTFDLNETMHVIDFAILTGQGLMIDYGGSHRLRRGIYATKPYSRTGGAEPLLEGSLSGGRKKRFHIRRINRIGVGVS